MSCSQIRKMIEDYHDGELPEPEASAVAAHVRDCAACRREKKLLEEESVLYRDYEASVEDSLEIQDGLWERATANLPVKKREPGSWKGVSAKTGHRLDSPWLGTPWIRQALAAVVLVAVSVAATLLIVDYRRTGKPDISQTITGNASESPSLDAALRSIQRAEQEYLNAIQVLTAVVEKQKSTLDPRIVREIQANLNLVDQHIAATRRAYYAHPADAELAISMLTAYSRKVELLQDLAS